MAPAEVLSFTKSTNGRSSWPRVPGTVQGTLGLIGRLAPGSCARAGEWLFLRPHRHPVPPAERRWMDAVHPREFRVRGKRIAGWSRGEGPTVLLVHGWAGRGSHLGAFVDPLVRAGFRAVGFDAPGHGASEGKHSSMPEMAAAVAAIGRQVGPLAGIVAHSLGTSAATLALHDGLRAERCVYLAPPAGVSSFPARFCDALGFEPNVGERLLRRLEARFEVPFDRLDPTWLARRFPTPPVLIVHDRHDLDVPYPEAEALARAWSGARLIATEGLGHRAIRYRPEVVERSVRFLLQGCEHRATTDAATAS